MKQKKQNNWRDKEEEEAGIIVNWQKMERLLTGRDKGAITVGANRVALAQLLQTAVTRTRYQHASL